VLIPVRGGEGRFPLGGSSAAAQVNRAILDNIVAVRTCSLPLLWCRVERDPLGHAERMLGTLAFGLFKVGQAQLADRECLGLERPPNQLALNANPCE